MACPPQPELDPETDIPDWLRAPLADRTTSGEDRAALEPSAFHAVPRSGCAWHGGRHGRDSGGGPGRRRDHDRSATN
jgi:hypothetical protein